jgi:hypothetical protein
VRLAVRNYKIQILKIDVFLKIISANYLDLNLVLEIQKYLGNGKVTFTSGAEFSEIRMTEYSSV